MLQYLVGEFHALHVLTLPQQMRARNRYLNCSAKPAAAAEGASFTNGPKNVKFHMSLDRVLSR